VPGIVTWTLIALPIALSFGYPQVVAIFVLTFDFYWFYKAIVLVTGVSVTFLRMRAVMAVDWRERALSPRPNRRARRSDRIPLARPGIAELKGGGARQAEGAASFRRLRAERGRDRLALIAPRAGSATCV
jgi:hypothetical protein